MARVNHGNLLQHAIECAAATQLVGDGGDLRLVCTHAMAPFESARSTDVHEHNRVLRDLLGQVACMPPEGAAAAPHPLVRAYAAAGATVGHYPNTAELLAGLIGREHLDGVLCEIEPDAVAALRTAWQDSPVRIEARPWREALDTLLPPAPLTRPWLFSMDPYSFLHAGERKQDGMIPFLEPKDFERLRPCLAAHVKSEPLGAFMAFVYGVDKSHAGGFRRGALALADRLGVARVIVGVEGPDGTRHLGAVLGSDPDLPALVAESWHEMKSTLGLR